MASLDDFFAKKDKKKGKSKKSIISNDELVRQLEETESKETLEEVIPSNKTIVEEPTEVILVFNYIYAVLIKLY